MGETDDTLSLLCLELIAYWIMTEKNKLHRTRKNNSIYAMQELENHPYSNCTPNKLSEHKREQTRGTYWV